MYHSDSEFELLMNEKEDKIFEDHGIMVWVIRLQPAPKQPDNKPLPLPIYPSPH